MSKYLSNSQHKIKNTKKKKIKRKGKKKVIYCLFAINTYGSKNVRRSLKPNFIVGRYVLRKGVNRVFVACFVTDSRYRIICLV